MMGTIMDTRTWTLPRAALTLLLSDFRLGEMPRPFEAVYPYTTVAERAAFRELTVAGELDPDLEWCLTALVAAPVGIVAMSPSLLARGCWHQRGAVLARQVADTIQVTALGTAPLVEAIVALVPDEKPAGGTSVTVPAETRTERRFSLYDHTHVAAAKPFTDPVIACGAFVPFARKEFLPPVTWFDTAGQRGIGRHFTTTTIGRDGTAWTTYVPGDNERIAGSLRQLVAPLLNR